LPTNNYEEEEEEEEDEEEEERKNMEIIYCHVKLIDRKLGKD